MKKCLSLVILIIKSLLRKVFSDGTSKTQYRYNPEGGFDLPRVNYKDTSSVDLSKNKVVVK